MTAEVMMAAGFMAPTVGGQLSREAWAAFRAMLREDARERAVVRQLAATEGGRELLESSRDAWRARGLEAPFEFVFEEEADG